ncbi:AAA domain-containing protein [Gracilibacillus ureilyticus]|uniref:AAA domain-containing protein n=1 Tax=Gracilibacillus ureilyticus TaxID=531814 RepID=A0A1H9V5D1_9BACI|nr:AAA family ATPase [Gracilibacillus ureilyticus]SES16788.1 AAA domain-containing protein [Gracilibacillus ureilyticus]
MKFVLIFGPQAVGKMTVGQALAKITGLKLLHNHMTIEMLAPIFGFTPEMWRLSTMFREEIFKSVSRSDLPGMIFTFVFAFNKKEDWEDVERICRIFESEGGEVCFVELEAELEARLKRNKTPNRLEHKPSKREIEQSEQRLIESMEKYRLNSTEGEIVKDNYMKINNTRLSAGEAAEIIKDRFQL